MIFVCSARSYFDGHFRRKTSMSYVALQSWPFVSIVLKANLSDTICNIYVYVVWISWVNKELSTVFSIFETKFRLAGTSDTPNVVKCYITYVAQRVRQELSAYFSNTAVCDKHCNRRSFIRDNAYKFNQERIAVVSLIYSVFAVRLTTILFIINVI